MGISLDENETIRYGKKTAFGKTYHTVRMPSPSEILEYEHAKTKLVNKRGRVDVISNDTSAKLNLYRKIIVKVEGFGEADIMSDSPDMEKIIRKIPLACLSVVDAIVDVQDEDSEDLRQD